MLQPNYLKPTESITQKKYKVDLLPCQLEDSEPPQTDPETNPVSQPESQDVGKYHYALQSRPAGVGAVPDGNKAVLDRPDQS